MFSKLIYTQNDTLIYLHYDTRYRYIERNNYKVSYKSKVCL